MAEAAAPLVILCADDYALTEGVSAGIEQLAAVRRLSATSVLVTTRHWPAHASRIAALRDRVAIGLHLNLTLGAPLGAMPRLAPRGRLPEIAALTRACLTGGIDAGEIAAETERQLARFRAALGFAPDFLDGHQHAHALPGVRAGVIGTLRRQAMPVGFLVRDPADSISRILARGRAAPKALVLAGLAAGFGRAVRAAGFKTNDGFGGVTDFAPDEAARDLASAFAAPGPRHLVMCHPGIPDAELASLDPVTQRRRTELDHLMAQPGLPARLWHPAREVDGPPVDWGRKTHEGAT